MPREIDRRSARTRKALHQALLELMLRKGYGGPFRAGHYRHEADVGRSTFYAHYTGKEDLLRSGFQMLREELTGGAVGIARRSRSIARRSATLQRGHVRACGPVRRPLPDDDRRARR
ncbi:hypothetical protein ACVOMV_01320 [Mesorhizobium atlanticum]